MISVVSYTHFGYKKDKKSLPTYRIVKKMASEGQIQSIYCVDYENTYDIDMDLLKAPIPGRKLIPRLLYLADKFPLTPDPRSTSSQLLDRFTARRIGDEDTLLAFPPFIETLRAAKASGSQCAVYAGGAHPAHYRDLLREEVRRYDEYLSTESTGIVSRSERHELSYELADRIFYLSDYAGSTFVENGISPEKLVKVGPLSAETDQYQSSNETDEFTVLCLTDITLLKGIQYLIEAWNLLDLSEANLVLCGSMDQPSRELLLPMIQESDSISFEGHVNNPKEFYSDASLFVHPSLTEGFSKVIAEAMASSLPVIITEHCQHEFIDEAGFAVPIRSPSKIADKIQYFYNNRGELDRRGSIARNIVENNTWNDFSERIMNAVQNLDGDDDA